MAEKLKDILKPLRKEAQEAKGFDKIIYDEMLHKIDVRFHGRKGVTRQEVIDEIERQRCETRASLEQIKQQVEKLDKGEGYIHWDEAIIADLDDCELGDHVRVTIPRTEKD